MNTVDLNWLRGEVKKTLEVNRKIGYAQWCDAEFDYTCPSNVTYPFQWFWDSCFHVIAGSHIDPHMAKQELRSLLINQSDDGFVSHITFWEREKYEAEVDTYAVAFKTERLTDEMQPPLLAQAISAVYEADGDLEFVKEILPATIRFFDWLDRVRVDPVDGLVRVFHPDETGLDHSPKFDELMEVGGPDLEDFSSAWYRLAAKYETVNRDPKKMKELDHFVVADVMTNVIYVENLDVLARLCELTGDTETAQVLVLRRSVALAGLESWCWNEEHGLYFDIAGRDRHQVQVNTFTALMPLLLTDIPEDRICRLIQHLLDPEEYWTPFPVPSVPVNHPNFAPSTSGGILVWRGPSWINSNWYLAIGLLRHGRKDLAQRIADKSVEAIRLSGFREYYNPFTGEGHGAPGFGWSTVVLDLCEKLDAATFGEPT